MLALLNRGYTHAIDELTIFCPHLKPLRLSLQKKDHHHSQAIVSRETFSFAGAKEKKGVRGRVKSYAALYLNPFTLDARFILVLDQGN